MFVQNLIAIQSIHHGYIAGSVTVGGQTATRRVELLDINNYKRIQVAISLLSGQYMFMGLDPTKEYLIMARDYKKEYEPAVWDYVTPATDLTAQEQQELWESWQGS